MRAETAVEILDDIIEDFESSEIISKFQKLASALENQSNSPSVENQTQVKAEKDSLLQALAESRLNDYPISLQLPLSEMQIGDFLPKALRQTIIAAFEGADLTPAVTLASITAIKDKAERLFTNAKNFSEAAEFFEIYSDNPEEDQFYFSIAIPREAVNNELDDFGKELVKLDKLFGVFCELATGSREDFTIKAISSTDLTVILDSLPAVAVMIATALERVTAIYEKMLSIVNLHKQMKANKLPDNVTTETEKFIAKTLKREIEAAAKEIESKYLRKIEAGRRNELKNEVRNCLRELAARFDRGYIFDIRGSEGDQEIEAETEVAQDSPEWRRRLVAAKREKLRFFRVEDEPILGLPGPEQADPGSES